MGPFRGGKWASLSDMILFCVLSKNLTWKLTLRPSGIREREREDASDIHWQAFNLKSLALWPNVLAVKGNSVMWCWVQWVGPSGILTRFCCTTHTSHCLLQRVELHRDDFLTHAYEWPFGAQRWPSAPQAMAIISHILKLLRGFWKQCNILLMNCEWFFFMSTRNSKIRENRKIPLSLTGTSTYFEAAFTYK